MGLEHCLWEGNFERVARRNQRGICQPYEESDAQNKGLIGEQVKDAESMGIIQQLGGTMWKFLKQSLWTAGKKESDCQASFQKWKFA